ncbi:unnamed protein product [Hyaloperonospora brassicae]|uniref:Uncharacterized protein n=1 Tax=Hyaloperonospora brassicae TaxID=162125 RepID=A0AAV0TGL9_HYABA|nr:unnamed protein product [Hyaloperonospora brassicae]
MRILGLFEGNQAATKRRECSPEPRDERAAAGQKRPLLPSRAGYAPGGAADGMLGMLANHADKQRPLLDQRERQRHQQHLPENPRPARSLQAAGARATQPPVTMEQLTVAVDRSNMDYREEKAPSLMTFLGRSPTGCLSQVPEYVTSPCSMWEKSRLKERMDPTASPRRTGPVTSGQGQTPPSTSLRRRHSFLLPDPPVTFQSHGTHKRRTSPCSPTQEMAAITAAAAVKRPRLARRVSSQWRQELVPRDRAQTRERMMRSLHTHCQGDYEKLVLLLSSMEEEMLYRKTASSDSYVQQAFELSALVEHATLER